MKKVDIEELENGLEITEEVNLFKNGHLIGNLFPNEPIATKDIKNVIDSKTKYFIPAYQRGYRWTEKQVNDLLDDIWQWGRNHDELAVKYSLQPIVIKKHDGPDYDYDLVDGQQRITTLFIIIKALRTLESSIKEVGYSISYETRTSSNEDELGSEEFLNSYLSDESKANNNIDFYHMNQAFETVLKWFKNDTEKAKTWFGYLTNDKNGAFFIEYNATRAGDTRTSESIFSGLNAGKIPLVDSELIKGLLLRSKNFQPSEAANSIIEISTEWDRIERKLRDKNFWAWLGQKEIDSPRIDFVLRTVAGEKDFYRYFSAKLDEGKETANEIWLSIKQCFMTFEDWYDDFKIYHLIGYLNQFNGNIANYYELYRSGKLDFVTETNVKDLYKKLDKVSYGENSDDIVKILLLFNVLTCINSKIRFRFDDCDLSNYDIEHISPHSGFDKMQNYDDREEWLKEIIKSGLFKEELEKNNIISSVEDDNKEFINDDDKFKKFYEAITDSNHLKDEIDSIGNLCLLDSNTNRSYGNKPFPLKVQTVMRVDADQENGEYILPATKNVFLKYYSGININNFTWDTHDVENYHQAIERLFKQFEESGK